MSRRPRRPSFSLSDRERLIEALREARYGAKARPRNRSDHRGTSPWRQISPGIARSFTPSHMVSLIGALLVNLIADVWQRAQIIGRQFKDHATTKKHIRIARHLDGSFAET